jgi:predicted Zn-dependent protease
MSERPRPPCARPWLLCLLLLAGCQPQGGEGPGGRRQTLALNPEQELKLGEQAYAEVLKKNRTVRGADLERVRRVGERIAEASRIKGLRKEMRLHLDDRYLKWEYAVIDDDKVINAFCLPGGKVAVYTGLLWLVGSDDELATVMGHEAGHVLAHHSSERIAEHQMRERAIEAANGALGRMDEGKRKLLIGVLGAGMELRGLSYSRNQESEADHIGLFLMTFAKYDPDQTVTFWRKMERATGGSGRPELLSDHPGNLKRIAQLQEWVPRAKGAYKAYKEGRVIPNLER